MDYSLLLFDLDDTLYSNSTGLWKAIRKRMSDFMRERLGFAEHEIQHLRQDYFDRYGTTLRGLQINHSVDSDEYLAYVHNLPLEEYLTPDPSLHDMLISLPQQKWIFTNADEDHASRVLDILGLTECFQGIIDVRALGFMSKPDRKAYQRALSLVNGTAPEQSVMFDDSARNLAPANQIGITTVLVGTGESHPSADYSVKDLNELPLVFPQLWSAKD